MVRGNKKDDEQRRQTNKEIRATFLFNKLCLSVSPV